MSIVALVSAIFAVTQGAVEVEPSTLLAVVTNCFGLHLDTDGMQQNVLLNLRLPRVVLASLAGCALAMAGAVTQALFRNPLADPGVLGIASGAALGAVTMIVLGDELLSITGLNAGNYALPAAAFLGALLFTCLVRAAGSATGETQLAGLILAGIAMNSIAGAGIGLLSFAADDARLRSLVFWNMGSFGGADWEVVCIVLVGTLGGCTLILARARDLNIILLGEAEARHLGIDVERLKRELIAAVALIVGVNVAVEGVIGFVGLVVPHVVRLLLGPDHRYLLPGCALLGCALTTVADVVARTLVTPAELPLGVVTALIGAPYFLWLLRHSRQASARC